MVIWVLRLLRAGKPALAGAPWPDRGGRQDPRDAGSPSGAAPRARRRRADAAAARGTAKVGFADLFRPPYLSLVVLFMVFNLCQAFGFYGFANWVPTLLVEKGITVTKSLQYSFIVAFAYPIAPLLAASFADQLRAQMDHLRRVRRRSSSSGWRSRN